VTVDARAALPLFLKLKAVLRSDRARSTLNRVIQGDCLAGMKQLADNSADLVLTDPPYGYSFMGKDWDKAVPSEDVWKECLRVLKPGAFAFVMSAPRSDVLSRMIGRMENAGFRMGFSTIYWTYASGFPKAWDIAKVLDKRKGAERRIIGTRKQHDIRGQGYGTKKTYFLEQLRGGAESPIARAFEGSYGGFQPKPAVEVIIVAMKPLSEKTFVDQALKNGKGITWLDDGRIPTTDEEHELMQGNRMANRTIRTGEVARGYGMRPEGLVGSLQKRGRFPANLIVSDDALKGSSKYFDLDAWARTLPFLLVPKASKDEKNNGLGHLQNGHPTVKPLKLMAYLITLGSRCGDVVLDPFLGSGATALAAKVLGRRFIGFELSSEYCAIAERRLAVVS